MTTEFKFELQTKLISGIGSSKNILDIIQENKVNSPLILVDEGVQQHAQYYQNILSNIKKKHTPTEQPILTSKEPTYDYLDSLLNTVKESKPDLIIGIGGGSTLDITKAIAGLLTNPGNPLDYRGFDQLKNPPIPTICIPTTAGTGSEVTINASFVDTATNQKMGINGRYMNATYAILDAKWIQSCPKSAQVSAGIDALVHGIESYICKKANQMTQLYAKEAVKILIENLPCITEDPDNLDKKQQLLIGSYLAGIAMTNSGSGIAAVLSYPTGVYHNVPHGICGGIFIASAIEFNIKNKYTKYADLYDAIYPNNSKTIESKNTLFLKTVQDICMKIQVPTTLNEWGITKDNIDELAKKMIPMQAAFEQNPIPFSAENDSLKVLANHVQ